MSLLRADAIHLPLADESVDLVVTSPPYFALRSYTDGGEHYDGQIGSEATPQEFLEALWAVTAECRRVLKPSGSMWVNLGDKYVADNRGSGGDAKRGDAKHAPTGPAGYPTGGWRPKSLMGLPWRYAIGCIDRLDLILRAEVVWSKPNGLPESVTDRVRRSHEQWFHFTREPRYFSAVDEVREPHADGTAARYAAGYNDRAATDAARQSTGYEMGGDWSLNPLGKLPGSVWTIPSEPLQVPELAWWEPGSMRWRAWGSWDDEVLRRLVWADAEAALDAGTPLMVGSVDHFAAFPQEWPRRIILGWSPSGICVECGEGRRPVVEKETTGQIVNLDAVGRMGGKRHDEAVHAGRVGDTSATITGYACVCPTPDAPTRPAVVADPFGGTGTVAMVARALGRYPVHVDLSADYLRLARWRVYESGHASKTLAKTNAERQGVLL